MNAVDDNFSAFEAEIDTSWDYDLSGEKSFREYARHIWGLEGGLLGVKHGEHILGFASFYYEPKRQIWLMEYFAVEHYRGIGFSKILLPTAGTAFENMKLDLGIAVKGGNKRAQGAIQAAIGANFVETGDETLFIVDLVPWTWGDRTHIADGLILAIESLFAEYQLQR